MLFHTRRFPFPHAAVDKNRMQKPLKLSVCFSESNQSLLLMFAVMSRMVSFKGEALF